MYESGLNPYQKGGLYLYGSGNCRQGNSGKLKSIYYFITILSFCFSWGIMGYLGKQNNFISNIYSGLITFTYDSVVFVF